LPGETEARNSTRGSARDNPTSDRSHNRSDSVINVFRVLLHFLREFTGRSLHHAVVFYFRLCLPSPPRTELLFFYSVLFVLQNVFIAIDESFYPVAICLQQCEIGMSLVFLFIARSCFFSYHTSETSPFAIPVYAAVMEMYFPEENTIIIFIILASSLEINGSLEQCLPKEFFVKDIQES